MKMSEKKSKIFSTTKEINEAIWDFTDEIANDKEIDLNNLLIICVDHGGKPFFNLVIDNLKNRRSNRKKN